MRNKRYCFINSSHNFWLFKSHACASISINALIYIASPFFRNYIRTKNKSPFNIECRFTISAAKFDIVSTSPEKKTCFRLCFFQLILQKCIQIKGFVVNGLGGTNDGFQRILRGVMSLISAGVTIIRIKNRLRRRFGRSC
jgi:hypothetical protein